MTKATEEEALKLEAQVDSPRLRKRNIFVVNGSNFTGYVVAGNFAWHEDNLEYDDPSYFSFSLIPGWDQQ